MSIGLPPRPSRSAVSRSFVQAEHAAALLCLTGAYVGTLVLYLSRPSLVLWPAALALLPMTAALVLLMRHRSSLTSAVYLVVGSFGVYGYTATYAVIDGLPLTPATMILSFPMIAVILVGGPGNHPLEVVGWCTTAFVFAEAASLAALQVVGEPLTIDLFVVFVYFGAIVILLLSRGAARRDAATRARFGRAAREDIAFTVRARARSQATAIIHDTVLNHLAVVASSSPGPMSADLRTRVEHDIDLLEAGDWPGDLSVGVSRDTSTRDGGDGLPPGFRDALESGVALGLHVALTGSSGALLRLDDEQDRTLGLAVTQCLVNVQRHSGVHDVEVAVHAAGGEVLVMVIDAGRGFDPELIDPDRIGLRSSVRERIEAMGGAVQVWSTPGYGTSVVLRLPVLENSGDTDADDPGSVAVPAIDRERRPRPDRHRGPRLDRGRR